MTTDVATARWRRIEMLFHLAAELPQDDREPFLEQVCEGDAELRAELDSLLASCEGTLTELRGTIAAAAHEMVDEPDLRRIGAYRLMKMLGEGGMGAVYLGARDDDQYERLVAIKLIRAGLSRSPALQLRFRTERQILANLDHPNIARMLDGGITESGSPYLVMEYIEGTPIDVFCRSRKLSLDDRLRLFRTLCTAVDYAHRHLVVHRDIKPMNVLVTVEGVPKLLDFGIAKLVDPYQGPTDAAVTHASQRLMTPDYASPEQLTGKPVSTATDVYALGTLLFDIVTGQLPFTAKEPMAQVWAVCEQAPPRPSDVAMRSGELPAGEARNLRGDLDSIVLKALSKEPEKRYANASELLGEIDRYLAGYAVEASGQGVAYRVGKFIRRHRFGTGIAALIFLLIVGFGIGMGLLARRAHREEEKARREEEFLASILQAATPEGSHGETLTARQLLDQAAKRIDSELAADPSLQAAMAENIGQSYVALGLYSEAQPLLEKAAEQVLHSEGRTSAVYADYLANLATDYRLRSQFQRAEPLFRTIVTLNESLHGKNSYAVAHSLSNLGEVLYLEDRDADAEPVLRRALTIERPLSDSLQDGTRSYLALVLERKGAFPEAAQLLHELTAIQLRQFGKENADYLITLHNLAGAQIDSGDLEGALKSDKEVLATREKIWGIDHPDTGYSLNNIGWIYLELGKWQEAEPYLKANLRATQKIEATGGPRYVGALANWGRLLQAKGDYAGAAETYDHAQYVLALSGSSESWMAAKVMGYQSALALDRGNTSDAIELATRAVKLQRKLGGDSSPQLATGLLTLGMADLVAGKAADAEASFRSALAIRERIYPASHSELLYAQARLAEALLAENQPHQALEFIVKALASAEAAPFPLQPWRVAELRIVKGLALRGVGRPNEAAPLFASNWDALQGYNQATLRNYLNARMKAGQGTGALRAHAF